MASHPYKHNMAVREAGSMLTVNKIILQYITGGEGGGGAGREGGGGGGGGGELEEEQEFVQGFLT
jgi:hypothetical protein